jgi:hypothetical protein
LAHALTIVSGKAAWPLASDRGRRCWFEVRFAKGALQSVVAFIEACGLTALVHPLTDADLADHTSLAHWIGQPLLLDLTALNLPAMNQASGVFENGCLTDRVHGWSLVRY